MDYRKLDPDLLDVSRKCIEIHQRLHSEGFHEMTGKEFAKLYHTNLNNYIAYIAHAMFDAGLNDAVIVLGDVDPGRQPEITRLFDHEQQGIRFTKAYAEDIALCKRKVVIQVFYLDGSSHYVMFGVKDVAAKKINEGDALNPMFN